MALNRIFYILKPFIPRQMQLSVRRRIAAKKLKKYEHCWPIDPGSAKLPAGWKGWPDKKKFALVLTHDVDTKGGQEKCKDLIKIEKELGFRSSFNFVPERYSVSDNLRHYLVDNGFEVGVHGLNHDGKLYNSEKIFNERASKINKYLKDWKAVGFRSPAMHHNLEWIHKLNIKYDASTFDTDPFEPQSDGLGTIFPFWVSRNNSQSGYLELPYTLPQDFTVFILMQEKDIDIWKRKLDWVAHHSGMALLNTHPDYMNFSGGKLGIEEYPAKHYERFLKYVQSKYQEHYWNSLPVDVARFVKNKSGRSLQS